jgi:hypothetical protein
MTWQGPEFVIFIVAICTAGWIVNNWIRARHGYALEDEWGGKTERADHEQTVRLRAEHAELAGRLALLERRTAAVEGIVTDRGYDLANQIEALRPIADHAATRETVK